ncbi:MAG: carbohydrate kinase family protein, partial [Acidobacteriota bacterium]
IINFKNDRTIFVQDVEREHDFQFHDVTTDVVYLTSLGREWQKPYEDVLAFVTETGASIAFNPGSRQLREGKAVVQKVLAKTHMLFINKEEAELVLFGKTTQKQEKAYMEDLMNQIRKLGPRSVVITDGMRGSYAMDEEGKLHFQGIVSKESIERTGAGDAYASGFLAGRLHGLPFLKAMEWGTWNATSVVNKIGAQAGLLKKAEMEEKVK